MNNNCNSIQQMVAGANAFYNESNYQEVTKKELSADKAPKDAAYECTIENKVWRVVKLIFSIIIFPIGICRLLHRLIGKVVVQSTKPQKFSGCKTSAQYATKVRKDIDLQSDWKVKRLAVKVDGYVVDAAIIGKPETFGNGRWVLASNGNAEYAEERLSRRTFKEILSNVKGNGIVFNYPGVGGSSGMPSRSAMTKAYRAMLTFLEDDKKGVGAKEIIGYGYSIGAATQGEALRHHKLRNDKKYVFVSRQTFRSLSPVIGDLTIRPLGWLSWMLGWNMNPAKGSRKLKAPEIVIQSADVHRHYENLEGQPEKIKDDGVISKKSSLAYELLKDKKKSYPTKQFIGVPELHCDRLQNISLVTDKINDLLLTA